ncbi:MAG: hypothetical protein JEZ09_12920 [Salinivirgaceae bacterium]|nr:hypothetical protein [Salinivirgaceae bacterium]
MNFTKFIIIVIIGISPIFIFGQDNDFKKQKSSFSDKLGADDYDFIVGSSVGTSFNDSYFFNNYFSPSAKFKLTKKFSTTVGVGVSYVNMNNMPFLNSEFNMEKKDLTMTSFYAYAIGNYSISKKMNLYTSILVEDATYNMKENSYVANKQYKDLSIGVNYQLSSKVTINAEFQFSDRPYSTHNRYSNNLFGEYSPFNTTPFY